MEFTEQIQLRPTMLQALCLGAGYANDRERCSPDSHKVQSWLVKTESKHLSKDRRQFYGIEAVKKIKQGGVVERDVRRLLCMGGRQVLSEVTLETS